MSRSPAPLRFLPIWILLTAFVVGCSKDSNPMGPGPNPQTNQGTLYVAQATGHDDNPGTEEAPFATITAALDAAAITSEIDTVRVGPGIYGSGESFPLRLPTGVHLIGDEDTRGDAPSAPTEISGFGPFRLQHGSSQLIYESASIIGADSTEVRGFRITAPGSTVNVAIAYVGDGPGGGSMTIARNTMTQLNTGVLADSVGVVLVEDNVIEDVIEGATFYSAAGPIFRDNTVSTQGNGVDIAVGPDGSLVAEGNHFELLSASGIGIYAQAASPLIKLNTIVAAAGVAPTAGILASSGSPILRSNSVAVSPAVLAWNNADVDMGDDTTPGENDFSQVQGLVLDVRGSAHVQARGNMWPHDPPRYGEDLTVGDNGTVDMPYAYELWVDVDGGDDASDGSQSAPLQTITAALQVSPPATRINVAPGTYGSLETFPLMMHPGLLLVGDDANRGSTTIIEGEGEHTTSSFEWATIVGASNAELVGVTLRSATDPFGYFGLMVDEGPMIIRHNTFANGYGAVTAAALVELDVAENTVRTKSYGVYTSGTEGTRIEGNDIATSIPATLHSGLIVDNQITINSYTGAMQANQNVRVENNHFSYQRQYDLDMRYAGVLVDYGSPRIRGNVFETNRGILVRNGTPDVGTGTDLGGNDFSATSICGVESASADTVYAIGNTWTNDPPQIGVDVVITGDGAVVTSASAK